MQSNNINESLTIFNNQINNSTAPMADFANSRAADSPEVANDGNLTNLAIHSNEFDSDQWSMISKDSANKAVAQALKEQGSAIGTGPTKEISVPIPSDSYYKELKRCLFADSSRQHLNKYFPDDYKPPPAKYFTEFSVSFASSERAPPKHKTIEFCLDEGIEVAVHLAKSVFSKVGIRMAEKYSLFEKNSTTKIDDAYLQSLAGTSDIVKGKFISELVLRQDSVGGCLGKDNKKSFDEHASRLDMQHAALDAAEIVKNVSLFHSGYKEQSEAPRICEVRFRYNCCYVACFCYYATLILHGYTGNEIVSYKEAIDCLCSLDRSTNELGEVSCPPELLSDARKLSDALKTETQKKIDQTRNENLAVTLMRSYPDLVAKTTYDRISPIANKLYPEQAKVLELIHESLTHSRKLVIGYKVPPSGGKTALSVALAAMIQSQFPGKQVLYCCYNFLVRMAVATACYQSETPFWVATTRKEAASFMIAEGVTELSQIEVSDHAKKGKLGFRSYADRFGNLSKCWAKAVEWSKPGLNPIVISDPISALELLKMFPDRFVLYLDEPTAGAESGYNSGNKIQDVVSQIMAHLPMQSVLLSATLPDLPTELPSLVRLVGKDSICMVETERLPVGCEAVTKDGYKLLPHELAQTFTEFQNAMSSIQRDSLMLRFYTPEQTYELSERVRGARGASLPEELHFLNYFSDIGLISAARIRTFTQALFRWLDGLDPAPKEAIFNHLLRERDHRLDLQAKRKLLCLNPSNLLEYVSTKGEGNTLAVTSTASLNGMVEQALKGWSKSIADFDSEWETYQKALEKYNDDVSEGNTLSNTQKLKGCACFGPCGCKKLEVKETKHSAKPKKKSTGGGKSDGEDGSGSDRMQRTNFGRDERQDRREALANMGKIKIEEPVTKPVWSWKKTLTSSTGAQLDIKHELGNSRLSSTFKSQLLTGIGVYNPSHMDYQEQCILIREASLGKIGCLFSDPNIVYGTNMPLITVYIGQAYGESSTRGGLYQLIGRAGRTGLANKARIVFEDNETLRRALLPGSESTSLEATTMEQFLSRFTDLTGSVALAAQKCGGGNSL